MIQQDSTASRVLAKGVCSFGGSICVLDDYSLWNKPDNTVVPGRNEASGTTATGRALPATWRGHRIATEEELRRAVFPYPPEQ